ncbi:MAG: hypothetical protein ABJ360_22785 [Roseobacter sp.]
MKNFLITAAFLSCATPVLAFEYVCDVRDIGNGFIAPTLALQFEENAKTGMVYDGVIHQVHGQPIEAKLKDRGKGKYRFSYRINDIPATPRPADISYQVNLDIQKNTVSVRGYITGVTNSIVGKGTCQVGRIAKN